MTEPIPARLTRYEEQLQQQLVRRTQLTEALNQCDGYVKRLEGAVGALRELLEPSASDPEPPTTLPAGLNGPEPTPEEAGI